MNGARFDEVLDVTTVAGFAVVAPLALGRPRAWTLAAVATAVALWLDRGAVAGTVALAAAGIAFACAFSAVRAAGPLLWWRRHDLVVAIAGSWSIVAALSLVASRFGLRPFGIDEPIVQLTAVHFLFAGAGAVTLAGSTASSWALGLTAGAPPIVALGFVTGWSAAQVGGAILMAAGVFVTAAHELGDVTKPSIGLAARILLAISGLAVWAPMVLAVAWAGGQHWDVPALSIPDMARWHGAPNAVGFVIAGLCARQLEASGSAHPGPRRSPESRRTPSSWRGSARARRQSSAQIPGAAQNSVVMAGIGAGLPAGIGQR